MTLKAFKISFSGLKEGKHQFDFEVDHTFFENFGFEDFNSATLNVVAHLDKKSTIMGLLLEVSGTVNVNCDVTNEPFNMPIESQMELVVKFGEEFNDDNEELLILPHGAYEFNIAQYIYEFVVLAVPFKRVHPGVEDGSLESEILDKLEELKPTVQPEEKEDLDSIDPRWDALKKLKTDNNL